MPRTLIASNGSKWAGQAPDSVAKLLDVLASTPLDPTFEDYGCFMCPAEHDPASWHFFGNFFRLSHVFSITSDDPAVFIRLRAAIRANMQSSEYVALAAPIRAKLRTRHAARARGRHARRRGICTGCGERFGARGDYNAEQFGNSSVCNHCHNFNA